MKTVVKTIKTRPRAVRDRRMALPQAAARVTASQAQAMKRRAERAREETKPEGEAVSTVQERMGQAAQAVPCVAYRLTRAQIRLLRRGISQMRQNHAPTEPFDDPAKRPLNAREIAGGRARLHARATPASTVASPPKASGTGRSKIAPVRIKVESTAPLHERPKPALPRMRTQGVQTVRTAGQTAVRTTVQGAQRAVSSSAQASTAAVRAGANAAKAAERAAQQAAQHSARKSAQAARHMAKVARKASQRLAAQLRRASEASVRAAILAARALLKFLIAGGWVIVLIVLVLVICASLLSSPFGIFTHSDGNAFPDSLSLDKAITTINEEYVAEIERLGGGRSDTHVVIQGNLDGGMEPANWVDVLAIFAVDLTMREEDATDVVELTPEKLNELRRIFWDMNQLTTSTSIDENGETTFYIEGISRSYQEMFEPYGFTEQQKLLIGELMSDQYYAFWANYVNTSMGYGPDDWGGVVTVGPDYRPSMSGSVMNIPKIYQFDYKQTVCTIDGQRKSVSTSGCGAASMSMVICYLTGNTTSQNPYTLFKWAYNEGYYSGDGLGHSAVSAMGRLYGVSGTWIGKDGEAIITALKSGHPIIAHMGKGIFTRNGHYIVLRGVTDDGKILVNDPNSESRSEKAYPLSTILNQSKTSEPFMVCSRAS